MKHFLIILSLFFCIAVLAQTGTVIKVKDGDTIVILDDLDNTYTIRVADIDCPENGQPFSNKAKLFVSKEIYGKCVTIKPKGLDSYKRIIGFVLYEDKNLSLELLKKGLAWHYSYYSDDKEMALLEKEAKKNRVGLWRDPHPVNPYKWRKTNKN